MAISRTQSEHDVTGFLVAPTNSSEPVATDSQPDTLLGRRGGRAHKTHRRRQICKETTETKQAPRPETPRKESLNPGAHLSPTRRRLIGIILSHASDTVRVPVRIVRVAG